MPDAPTILENRVRFAETDLHGHVFYGEFLTYADETFNAFLRRIDYPYNVGRKPLQDRPHERVRSHR